MGSLKLPLDLSCSVQFQPLRTPSIEVHHLIAGARPAWPGRENLVSCPNQTDRFGWDKQATRLVGAKAWIDDPRFATDASRGEHGELVSARMQAWCDGRLMHEVLAELEAVRRRAAGVV